MTNQLAIEFMPSATGLPESVMLTSIVTVVCRRCGGSVGYVYRFPASSISATEQDVYIPLVEEPMDQEAAEFAESWAEAGREVPPGWDGEMLAAELMASAKKNGRRLNFGTAMGGGVVLSTVKQPRLPGYCGACRGARTVGRLQLVDAVAKNKGILRAT